jgi:hypothetical protein
MAATDTVLVGAFTTEQIDAFERDGFVIVEEGLVSPKALELLRERYARLFDGEYKRPASGPTR